MEPILRLLMSTTTLMLFRRLDLLRIGTLVAHRHKLFCSSWMYTNRGIEVRLGRLHLHGYPYTLDDFSRVDTYHMRTYNALGLPVDD